MQDDGALEQLTLHFGRSFKASLVMNVSGLQASQDKTGQPHYAQPHYAPLLICQPLNVIHSTISILDCRKELHGAW